MQRITTLLLAALLAGCASQGDVSNPVVRKFTWFSFVEGADIRAACAAGGPDRYRMVLNAVYEEQRRIYELDGSLKARVVAGRDLTQALSLIDGDGPWRDRAAEVRLDPEQRRRLVDSLAESGAFGPPDVGLELPSRGFYWTVASCHGGRYTFNAWLWPDAGFQRLSFPAVLAAFDATGVPVNPPRSVPPRFKDKDPQGDFALRVGANGLAGTP